MKENIILLHGALGSKEQLENLGSKLENNYNVVLFDLEGHGSYSSDMEFSMDRFSKQIISKMDELGVCKSHFFGYSMGGYAALFTALKNSDRVGDIVCLGTKLDWNPDIADKETKMLNPELIQEKVPHFAKILEERHWNWIKVLENTAILMQGLGNGQGLSKKDYSKIKNKVMFCLGEEDKMVSKEEVIGIKEVMLRAEWKIIEDTPHAIEKAKSEELACIIHSFIKKLPAVQN